MADQLTDAELIRRLKSATEHGSAAAAARAEGLAVSGYRASIQQALAKGLTAGTVIVDEADRLRSQVKELQVDVRNLKQEALVAEDVRKQLYGLSQRLPEPPKWMLKAARNVKTPGVPMTIWSDWHWGEAVNANQTGGANTYSRAVAKARVRSLVSKTVSLVKDHMVRPEYPGIVVALAGDMITGAIHEELAVTNWGTVQQQVNEVTDELAGALEQMADAFGNVFVPCVCGNHGRDTIKPRAKNYVFQSYEWNVYNNLERYFRKDKRLVFAIAPEPDYFFKVYNHRFLLTHGDNLGVKGGDGIIGVIGPIARGAFKLSRSEARIGRDFDTLLIGHYHTRLPFNDACPVIANGSMIGYNEYARFKLRVPFSRPSQEVWFVHPDHGLTTVWPIYLDDRKPFLKGTNSWVSFEERSSAK